VSSTEEEQVSETTEGDDLCSQISNYNKIWGSGSLAYRRAA